MPVKKYILLASTSLLIILALGSCSLFSQTARLSQIDINVDGDPAEWEPFPTVHVDPKGDNVTIDYDMSVIKAFNDNQTHQMYMLIESYITPKELTSMEIDLEYGDEYYRLGLPFGDDYFGAIARQTGEAEQWETVEDRLEYSLETGEAIEIAFPTSQFPDADQLKIAKVRIMGGICCNQYEYFAIDFMN